MTDESRRGKTVSRSPKQVWAKARSIAEGINESSNGILGMIGSRGCSLAERYGVPRAAERIVDMFDVDCVVAIARALKSSSARSP